MQTCPLSRTLNDFKLGRDVDLRKEVLAMVSLLDKRLSSLDNTRSIGMEFTGYTAKLEDLEEK